jgi:hypothetical protein
MAKSTNGKKRSAVRTRSANVTESDIARRAYELYLARGCEDGHDVHDWLQAEQELQERSMSMNRDELDGKAESPGQLRKSLLPAKVVR